MFKFQYCFISYLRFQEVKAQPQNLLLDSIFDDPWTAALRFDFNSLSCM